MIVLAATAIACAVILGLTFWGAFDPHVGAHTRPKRQPARDADLINTPTAPVVLVQVRPTEDTLTRLHTIGASA